MLSLGTLKKVERMNRRRFTGEVNIKLRLRMPDAGATEKVHAVTEIVSRLPKSFSVYRNGRLRVR